jgi:hypothetical protein
VMLFGSLSCNVYSFEPENVWRFTRFEGSVDIVR